MVNQRSNVKQRRVVSRLQCSWQVLRVLIPLYVGISTLSLGKDIRIWQPACQAGMRRANFPLIDEDTAKQSGQLVTPKDVNLTIDSHPNTSERSPFGEYISPCLSNGLNISAVCNSFRCSQQSTPVVPHPGALGMGKTVSVAGNQNFRCHLRPLYLCIML
ncbi:hypothetical protein EDB86DRAFT_992278 [Lactarius hatsudake]|nr:hypothetical protein EDB86DRAFT_992278 [Lactarius hatsudake]